MQVALVKPCWQYPISGADHTYNRRWPPLELLNCAAILELAGHEVQVVDAQARGLPPEETARQVGSVDMILVTSSALDRWQCPSLELGPLQALLKTLRAGAKTVGLLGFHGTVEPAAMLDSTDVDLVVRGEPELTVANLAAGHAWDQTPGLTFRRGGELVSTPDRPPIDMTVLPVPAYHLIDLRHYDYEVLGPRFAVLEGSRGCPYPCDFCSRVIQGRQVRQKTVEQLGREVDFVVNKRGARSLYFIDLEFTGLTDIAEGISNYLLDHDISVRWCCQTRTDQVTEPLLQLMKRAGCRLIHFGIETGSQRIADQVRKRVTVQQQREGVELAKRVGLDTLCFFLLGHPGETEEEMRQTIRLAHELNPTYAAFHRVSPYQGTPLFDQVASDKCDLFPAFAGTADQQQHVDEMVRQAMRSYYLRPRYMLSRLLRSSPKSLWQQFRLFTGYLRR